MRNFLIGLLVGVVLGTGATGLAQMGQGSIFGDGDLQTFQDRQTGVTGSLFSSGGLTTYWDSTGRTGSYFSPTPMLGTYKFSRPCGR